MKRLNAIDAVVNTEPNESFDYLESPAIEVFGEKVFSFSKMKDRLPEDVYKSLMDTVENNAKIDSSIADIVAAAMKDWALSLGATHYAHVFQPLTGYTAEKHDSMLELENEKLVPKFDGETLMFGEPDGSSFPNGGIRATNTARGYTAWDVTSPAYVMESPSGTTLCIPTVFISWTGEALDKKTPVLRSMQALDKQATRILKLFGHKEIDKVVSYGGPEQEYFLIDKNFYFARPDLMACGRTLFGAPPPKGQEFDDHYFGAIPDRVLSFMMDAERELFELGIPIKTRHNEVAPGQYEVAPSFEPANLVSDHNQLVMTVFKKTALRHGFVCLMHEKPFKDLNGSGKHLNWSMGNKNQGNLFKPGETPHENAQFLVFCSAVIHAVYHNAELLRAAVASATNDHRLGANEAPPAIISIFLGDQLADIFQQIKKGGAKKSKKSGILNLGIDSIPEIPKHSGDRNRTSPFAFTGNRFEYRAVGSNQSISTPLYVLNTIVADSLDYMAKELETATKGDPKKLNSAIQKLLQGIIKECETVLFEGDGYSEKWHKEAEKRGLPNLRTTADALTKFVTKEAIALFKKHKVLSKVELISREEVYTEQYVNHVNVESNLVVEISKTVILPAAIRYQSELASNKANLLAAGVETCSESLVELTNFINSLQQKVSELSLLKQNLPDNLHEASRVTSDEILPKIQEIRVIADDLEALVADDLWPLPSYQEMLFIK